MKSFLTTIGERPIAFHRIYVAITGSLHAGLLLAQAVYWSQTKQEEGGWFWKTQEQWEEETCICRDYQEKARRILGKIGVLEEKLQGVPAKLYFRVNFYRLVELIECGTGTATKRAVSVLETASNEGTGTATIKDTENTVAETTSEMETVIPIRTVSNTCRVCGATGFHHCIMPDFKKSKSKKQPQENADEPKRNYKSRISDEKSERSVGVLQDRRERRRRN